MKLQPYMIYTGGNGSKRGTREIDAYLLGDLAVHRWDANNKYWVVSYGGYRFPGFTRSKKVALQFARILNRAHEEGWTISQVTEAVDAFNRERGPLRDGEDHFRCSGSAPDDIVLYEDHLHYRWLCARRDLGSVKWPEWYGLD